MPVADLAFSPPGCTDTLLKWLDKAKQSIYVQAYSFTNRPIAMALVRARFARKAIVSVILDASDVGPAWSQYDYMLNNGIEVLLDRAHAIAHNKVMIIDERWTVTGSFNFTNAAEHNNAENMIVIDDKKVAKQYLDNWKLHKSHSGAALVKLMARIH